MTHTELYFKQVAEIAVAIDHTAIERLADELVSLREGGWPFVYN